MGEVVNGAQLTPLAQSADGSWIEIHRPGFEGQTAWIVASAVGLSGAALPEAPALPLPVSTAVPAAPPESVRIAGRIAFVSMRAARSLQSSPAKPMASAICSRSW